jgi:ABC-type sugar transport system ATPase subunit
MDEAVGGGERGAAPPFVVAEGISKSFGGVDALADVTIELAAGEVHGLVGANGAGKSTLIRVLAGLVAPDAGVVRIDGRAVEIRSPHDAADLGMSFIHQELAIVPAMTVIENVTLGLPKRARAGLVDWGAMAAEVAPIAARVGLRAPLSAKAKTLSVADVWLVNICRALVRRARLIVMDEPTASLSASEAERLFAIVEDLSRSGVAVLYVSHRLDEVLRLCRVVTALRDGRRVARLEGSGLTRGRLVEAIVGAAAEEPAPRESARGPCGGVVLSVRGLARLPAVRGIDLDLHAGEVLGLGGLVGAGRSELARLICGADRPDAGAMTLGGRPFAPRDPGEAVRRGLGYVPEERRSEALILTKSVAFNAQLANVRRLVVSPALPFLDGRRRRTGTEEIIRRLGIRTPSTETPVIRLSGGNQQKVVIGRWLLRRPDVLVLDEPTRGVDIGARRDIHHLVRALAGEGMGVLVISSEPDELPDLCDRVLVMAEGRIVRELAGAAMTRHAIITASYAAAA